MPNNQSRRVQTQNIQDLATRILNHLQSASEQVARGRGRTTHRGSTRAAPCRGSTRAAPCRGGARPRSVSFQCACGPVCTSTPDTGAAEFSPSLNPEARSFVPRERSSSSRNVARRSKPRRSGVVRPAIRPTHHHAPGYQNPDTGRVETGEPLLPPSYYQAVAGDTAPSTPPPSSVQREGRSSSTSPPPLEPVSPPRLRSLSTRGAPVDPSPVSPPRDSLEEDLPAPPPPPEIQLTRERSPVPDQEERAQAQLLKTELAFQTRLAPQFSVKERLELRKSFDYSCACLQTKSECVCSEAVLDVVIRVKYRLTDPSRFQSSLGGNEL